MKRTIAAAVAAGVIVLGAAWYGTQSDVDDTHQQVQEILNESG